MSLVPRYSNRRISRPNGRAAIHRISKEVVALIEHAPRDSEPAHLRKAYSHLSSLVGALALAYKAKP